MKTVVVVAALFIGVATVGAQAQTTNSAPNSTQTRTGAGVDAKGTSGMGSGTTTDSRATRAYPANGSMDNSKTGSMNRRRSSTSSPDRTGAGVDPQGTSGMGSGTTTDSRATRAYPADAATTNSMSTQSSTSKKTTTKTKKSGN